MHFYDPDRVQHIIGGIPISGFAEDELSTFEEDDDRFTVKKGAAGGVTRSKNPVFLGTLTIKLMSSSVSNSYLSALHQADILTPGGGGVVPCAVNDLNGDSVLIAPRCWVIKPPANLYSKEASPREWKIQLEGFKNFVGGNPEP